MLRKYKQICFKQYLVHSSRSSKQAIEIENTRLLPAPAERALQAKTIIMAELASCTIYIKGIAETATEADVRDACSLYGNITEVAIPEGKDFCFVEFAEEAQAQVGVCLEWRWVREENEIVY